MSIFTSDNWLYRTCYSIRSWFRYTFNKQHLRVVKEAFNGRPWDEGYLLDLEYAKIKEMVEYHKRATRFVGVENVIRDMNICLSLIEIFTGKRDTFSYDGKLEFIDADEDMCKELGEEGLKELKPSSDFKYHCNVKVNVRNADRFLSPLLSDSMKEYMIEHPHEIYELKARYLYHKIRREKEQEWWD